MPAVLAFGRTRQTRPELDAVRGDISASVTAEAGLNRRPSTATANCGMQAQQVM